MILEAKNPPGIFLGPANGSEIPIDRIEGKWKVSQNRSDADRQGVQDGLRCEGASEEMAQLVADRAPILSPG